MNFVSIEQQLAQQRNTLNFNSHKQHVNKAIIFFVLKKIQYEEIL